MGRGRKLATLSDFNRAIKNGYGIGQGKEYLPWLRVQDVKSHGVRSQIWGRKTNREHHTLSSIESQFFYLAEFCDSVIDIREQFPLLPLNISQKIAASIGVAHPKIPSSGEPNIITTDFLLTRKVGGEIFYEAVSVKPESESNKQRVLEKIDIERVWWELLGIKFHYFTGNELTQIQSRNICWVTAPYRSTSTTFSSADIELALENLVLGKQFTTDICRTFMNTLGLHSADALSLLRFLIAEKYVVVDMSQVLEDSGIMEILHINELMKLAANGYR